MKTKTISSCLPALLICLLCVPFAGCGGDSFGLAPISGTVTLDGEPAEGVGVTFTPQPKAGSAIVGPFSYGTTDAAGKFTLKSKKGDPGAVVGEHSIDCQFESFDRDAMEALMERMDEAKRNGDDMSKFQAKMEAAKNQKRIPEDWSMKYTVEPGGNNELKIDITTKDNDDE